MGSLRTALTTNRSTRHYTGILGIGSSSTTSRSIRPNTRILGTGSSSDGVPLVILRVQILSCDDLEGKGFNGYSDPCARFFVILPVYLADLPLPALPRSLRLCSFVIVTIFGKECKTPVCKRNLHPRYEPRDATFEFPISFSLMHKFGSLELRFVVWNKGMIGKDFLGKYALSINEWFRGTAIAFDDPDNKVRPFTAKGTKVGTYTPFAAHPGRTLFFTHDQH